MRQRGDNTVAFENVEVYAVKDKLLATLVDGWERWTKTVEIGREFNKFITGT